MLQLNDFKLIFGEVAPSVGISTTPFAVNFHLALGTITSAPSTSGNLGGISTEAKIQMADSDLSEDIDIDSSVVSIDD